MRSERRSCSARRSAKLLRLFVVYFFLIFFYVFKRVQELQRIKKSARSSWGIFLNFFKLLRVFFLGKSCRAIRIAKLLRYFLFSVFFFPLSVHLPPSRSLARARTHASAPSSTRYVCMNILYMYTYTCMPLSAFLSLSLSQITTNTHIHLHTHMP